MNGYWFCLGDESFVANLSNIGKEMAEVIRGGLLVLWLVRQLRSVGKSQACIADSRLFGLHIPPCCPDPEVYLLIGRVSLCSA